MAKRLDQVEELLNQCHRARDAWIEKILTSCDCCCRTCEGQAAGHLEELLVKAEAALDKVEVKQDRFIQVNIGNAYRSWVNVGGHVPGDGELLAEEGQPVNLPALLAELAANREHDIINRPERGPEPRPAPQAFQLGQPALLPEGGGLKEQPVPPPPAAFPGLNIDDLGGLVQDALKNQLAMNGALPPPQRDALNGFADGLRRPGGNAAMGKLIEDVLKRLDLGLVGPGPRPRPQDQRGVKDELPKPGPPPVPPFPRFDIRDRPDKKKEEEEEKKDKEKLDAERLTKGSVPNWCSRFDWRQASRMSSVIPGNRWTDILVGAAKRLEVGKLSLGDLAENFALLISSFNAFVGGCKDERSENLARFASVVNAFYQYLGYEVPGVRTSLRQTLSAACPQGVPSPDQAQQLWLQNRTDRARAEAWWAANDLCPNLQQVVADLNRLRPGAGEVIALFLRGDIDDHTRRSRLEELGVTKEEDAKAFEDLAKFIPPAGDLVSFMVRDVFDEAVVKKYGYDEEFTAKFTGKAKAWAKAQGMTEDQFRFYWRAHWRLISPGQGYEMLHRLRPGRVGDDVATTAKDIEQLLEIDDYPAFWRARLIATSYKPLTRVDVQRAFFIGSLSEVEVRESYLDLGYDKENAARMTRFTVKLRQRWLLRQIGAPSPAAIAGLYADGLIPFPDLVDRIREWGFEPDDVQTFIKQTDKRREVARRKVAIRSVKARYLQGMVPDQELQQTLLARDIDPVHARRFAVDWKNERDLIGKHLTAPKLCDLASRQLITPEEYQLALMRLGYQAREARRLADLCAEQQHDRDEKKVRRLTPAELCRAFDAELIDRQQFGDGLVKRGFDQAGAELVIDLCSKAAKDKKDKKKSFTPAQICTAQLDGLLTQERAVDELRKLGFDDEHALILATECTKAAKDEAKKRKGKSLTPAQLCRAWKSGQIGPSVFLHSMQDQGYETEDALIVGNLCAADLNKEQRAAFAKFVKDVQAAADRKAKGQKEAAALERQADQDAAKAQKERLAMLEKARKAVDKAVAKAKDQAGGNPAKGGG